MSLFAYFDTIARLEELKNEVNEDWLRHQRKLLNKECDEIYRNFVRGQIRERIGRTITCLQRKIKRDGSVLSNNI